jgi:hypothetical protein
MSIMVGLLVLALVLGIALGVMVQRSRRDPERAAAAMRDMGGLDAARAMADAEAALSQTRGLQR